MPAVVGRPHDRRDPARFCRSDERFESVDRKCTMLAIQQDPIEAERTRHLDDRRRIEHDEESENRAAGGQTFFQLHA